MLIAVLTAVLQNLWHVLDQNATAPVALAEPRLHDQLTPNVVSLEYAYSNETAAFLRLRGHNVTYTAPGGSTAQSLRRLSNGTFEAAGEPRQVNSGGFAV
jgi:gamma-glutamyltranspeptidase/glutathione hydrolase